MHTFLLGPKNIGKSSVIRRMLDMLLDQGPFALGGFITWREGTHDPRIYMRPAQPGREREIYLLASYDAPSGGMHCVPQVFDEAGTRLLAESAGADIILMDELGFLESRSPVFQQAVCSTLAGNTPVIGVMRSGNIPWHEEIKASPRVRLCQVSQENRDTLPQELAVYYQQLIKSGWPV